MIGCLLAFGSKPLAFEAAPFFIDSLIDGVVTVDVIPSFNVSKIVFA